MKNSVFIFTILLISSFSFSQNRKGSFRLQEGSNSHFLYVSFNSNVDFEGGDYIAAITNSIPEFKDITEEYGIKVQGAILIEQEKFNRMEQQAIMVSGTGAAVNKLKNIVQISIDNPTNSRLYELAKELEKFGSVEYCSLISAEPIRPPYDIAPITPLYDGFQGYSGSAGVKMEYAWDLGFTGSGINVRDIEYGFNSNHEEFNEANAFIAPDMTVSFEAEQDYAEHGTAVFGVMYSDNGDYGTTGMAYGAEELVLFPEWQQSGYNRVNAVAACLSNSSAGDVVLYEMQTGGALGDFAPAEYNNVIWDLTKAGSDVGIVIIAAAGNGNENMDDPAYLSYMDRGDSGAIIVGAGTNNSQHDRLGFSTFGERVDVQGWGVGVFTTGYGSFTQVGGDFNQSYSYFSGTSSATPIVASCAIVLQSCYHSLTGEYLTGQEMRELLKTTGVPQGTGAFGNIGPFPNMENAINTIFGMLGTNNEIAKSNFSVYPNPVTDFITVNASDISSTATARVYNTLGQLVHSCTVSNTTQIDFTGFTNGVYTIHFTDGDKVSTSRVIKR